MACCAAGDPAPDAAAEPDWAGLSPDLWRNAFLAGAGMRDDLAAYAQWSRQAATCSCVCRALRTALLGPDSGELWEVLILSSTFPGLSPRQSRGLNALMSAQAHLACSVDLHGGGWDTAELATLLGTVRGLQGDLSLLNVSPGEAAIVSRTLAAQPFTGVRFRGTAACLLPPTARQVALSVPVPDTISVMNGQVDQAPFQRFLGCLRPLHALQSLTLQLLYWQLTERDVHQLGARHLRLRELELHLMAHRYVGRHALESLQRLSVQLSLTVHCRTDDGCLHVCLQQLQALELQTLVIITEHFGVAEEALLARCSIRVLVMSFKDPARRLQQPPSGVRLVYEPGYVLQI